MTGRKPEQIIGQVAYTVLPAELAAMVQSLDKRVLDTGRMVESEATFTHEGTTRSYYLKHLPLINDHGQVYAVGAVAVDLTNYKQEQGAIQQQSITSMVLRERERLARDVDTTMATLLGQLGTQAQAVQSTLDTGNLAQIRGTLTDLLAMIQDAQSNLHSFAMGISTDDDIDPAFATLYHERGFFPALCEYARRYAERFPMVVEADIPPYLLHEELPSTVQIHLLHVIHELLTTAHHTIAAQHVRLAFALQDRMLNMTITDDGQHFVPSDDPTTTTRRVTDQGYVLRRTSERVREVGGTLEICQEAADLMIQISIPLRRQGDLRAHSIQILIASDKPDAQTLQTMLTTHGLQVVGTTQSGADVVAQARALSPDIILLDVALPPGGASPIVQQIKAHHPDIAVVIVSRTATDDELFEAIRSGAAGYVPLSLPPSDLISLLLGLQRGEMAVLPAMAKKILEAFAETGQPDEPTARSQSAPDYLSSLLSPRQMEVLWLVAQDYTYREVGEILGFSERTIKHYMSSSIKQLQLQNRAEAIALVRQRMNKPPTNTP
jgi:two-component system NarL family response regulator